MTTLAAEPLGPPALPDSAADAVYRKVAVRLIPLLFLCYIAAYLDRVNVSFAKLQMQQQLGLSESVYGLGSGIFFIGYFIFEIPSNVMLHKVGAGRWIARIMVTWAILSAAMMFVSSATSFYIVRFLLGVAEAGFFPGIILYLTYWFPAARRGRATSLFLAAIAVAGLIGNPISGWIMHSLSGAAGLQGWQWLFILEALPSLVLGVLAWFWLEDRVKNAQWLTPQERDLIARDIAAEESHKADGSLGRVLSDGKIWLCAFIYFAIVSGLYGVTFWLPTIIKELGIPDPLQVGLIGAVPWAFGIAAMYLMARSADRRHEYRWHTAVSCVASAVGLVISVAFHADALLAMTGLTIAAMGIMSALPIFWSNPTALLGGTAAAMGIAFINSVGNLAGFAIPLIIGVIKDRTHSTDAGLHMLAVLMILGAIAVLILRKPAAR
ncbi:MFS transporter [Scleromatobacter humisilvae]|uniref:MFS transporter n=1 Tax=Scleromatobacter humisilvae TaxID=2897159 RepID=A0A9X2BXD3_9BURK|nr:MFS transporter [Scleromatobacter humisilvae]MCK9684453.1 MFS transporter [Scleromatobacter humisilvae]